MNNKILKYLKNPLRFFTRIIVEFGFILPDSIFIPIMYYNITGKKLNLKNPKTFNEKLQWLKLNDRNPEYSKMVDKINAKEWVAEKIGKEYIIPTLGVWDNADNIDFSTLPNQFVMKTNHDSGKVVVCKDKSALDKNKVRKLMVESLKYDYYKLSREWPYKNVTRRILAEEYLEDNESPSNSLVDYKLMCFNGRVEFCFACSERNGKSGTKITIFDRDWKIAPFKRPNHLTDPNLSRPKNYTKMIELAEILSQGIKFLRVDFYEINNRIYFGELTFFPAGGVENFDPIDYDLILGNLLKI